MAVSGGARHAALEAAGVPTGPLDPVAGWTICLSVVVHGFSAVPFARWYGRFIERLPDDAPERMGEGEPPRAGWTFHGHQDREP